MCGIAGIFGKRDDVAVNRMLDNESHRGPDGRGTWISRDDETTMGQVRLAIMDVRGGRQPISNEDETIWSVVNGEIYNYPDLRQRLEGRHTFRTKSDSEVIPHLFEEKGSDMIHDLDGMFAFALWAKDYGLCMARDPLGIKPLYYGFDRDQNFYFASEMKSLISEIPKIEEFPNGHFMTLGDNPFPFYSIPSNQKAVEDEEEALSKIENRLVKAVNKRLMSDVPVGVFLSGGLDSSLISSLVRQHVKGELHSFSVGLEGSADIMNARTAAAYLRTAHHERILKPGDIIEALPEVIRALESCDPALVRSAVPTFYVAELASKHVKVVLSGEGADEIFGGYHYLRDFGSDSNRLNHELYMITAALHNTNLQRVDRMTMAHGLEGRVPFLDTELVKLAFQIIPEFKNKPVEKWLLRKVGEKYLPHSIAWRKKEKFAVGTGISNLLEQHADFEISDEEFRKAKTITAQPFQSKEELLYWNHFKKDLGRSDIVKAMGRSRSLNPGQRWHSSH